MNQSFIHSREKCQTGIYRIFCSENQRSYIGSSERLRHRLKQHRTCLRGGYHDSTLMQRSWNKYGENAFSVEIIELLAGVTTDELLVREQYWMDEFRSCDQKVGFNRGSACSPGTGRVVSKASRKRMSLAQQGKKHTEATKEKIRKSNLGRVKTAKECINISISQRGKKMPAGFGEMVRARMIGVKRSKETSDKIALLQLRGEDCPTAKLTSHQVIEIRKRYPIERSQSRLAREFSVAQSAISGIVNNKTWKHLPLSDMPGDRFRNNFLNKSSIATQ